MVTLVNDLFSFRRLVIIIAISGQCLFGQNPNSFHQFSQFSVSANGLAFMKGEYDRLEGDYGIESRTMISAELGVNYMIFDRERKWNLITGFLVGIPPAYSLTATIKKEDLFTPSSEDATITTTQYSHFSLNLPLLLEYNIRMGQKHFLSASAGFQLMLLGGGFASTSYVMVDDDRDREVFSINVANENPPGYASAVVGVGDYIVTRAGLFFVGISFNKSLKTLFTGEYSYQNLAQSNDTKGTYKFQGDYLSLSIKYSWRKKNVSSEGKM